MNWKKAARRTLVMLAGIAVLGFAAVTLGSFVGDRKSHRHIATTARACA